MQSTKFYLLALFFSGLLGLITIGTLNPNTFGNTPDLFQDESYFLSSALSALENHTLPGWDFSPSGAYYGGVQAHVDTLAIAGVLAYKFVGSGFSTLETKMWVATHTGDLLHVLRLVNGLLVVSAIAFFLWYFSRRKVPAQLALALLLILFLVLGNTVIVGLVHTAKVWTIYLLIDVTLGTLFLTNEYFISRLNRTFLSKNAYAAILVWGSVLLFFQNFVGVFSALLWSLYALFLGHVGIRDIYDHVRRNWYWIVLLAATQVSFVYRSLYLLKHPSVFDLGGTSQRTVEGGVDWLHRLYTPVVHAFESQPLIALYPIGILIVIVLMCTRNRPNVTLTRENRFLLVALAHPIAVIVLFHVVAGFSLFPRYSIMLAVACSFSAAMLLSTTRKPLIAAVLISGILFSAVQIQATRLFWNDASAIHLTRTIEQTYNNEQEVFMIGHSAYRLSLPMNAASLLALDDARKEHGRFRFLLDNLNFVPSYVAFQPLVLFADTAMEESAATVGHRQNTEGVWLVSQECDRLCTLDETRGGSCFVINEAACRILSPLDQHEYPVLTAATFFSLRDPGVAYIVRKINR